MRDTAHRFGWKCIECHRTLAPGQITYCSPECATASKAKVMTTKHGESWKKPAPRKPMASETGACVGCGKDTIRRNADRAPWCLNCQTDALPPLKVSA